MTKLLRPLGFVLALAFLVLTFVNASWIVPTPRGYLRLVAHRGVSQLYSRAGLEGEGCPAARIEQPFHNYLENTIPAIRQAEYNGAQMVQIDVTPTKDGKLAVFHDAALECRTDGTGKPGDHTMAELRALDAGYGYSADGGKSFPLRGLGRGLIPGVEDVLQVLPEKPILFTLRSTDPAAADFLVAALKAAGRKVEEVGDGFTGAPAAIARVRAAYPKAWAFDPASAEACTAAYRWQGWLGLTPAACQNGTMVIALDRQWSMAGWPNRLIARMEAANARIIVTAPQDAAEGPAGLTLPEQLAKVPSGFNGYLWIDDMVIVGPALREQYGKRNPEQEKKVQAALERRRAAVD